MSVKYLRKYQKGGREEVNKFYQNYLNSPNYKKRLKTQGYDDPEFIVKERLKRLGEVTTEVIPNSGINGYYPKLHGIVLDPVEKYKKSINVGNDEFYAHEMSHAISSMNDIGIFDFNEPDYQDYLRELNNLPNELNANEIRQLEGRNRINGYLQFDRDYNVNGQNEFISNEHDSNAGESKADIDALRYKLFQDKVYDTGTQDFDKETLEKAKQMYRNNDLFKRLRRTFSDDNLIYLMNNIARNDRNVTSPILMRKGGYFQKGGSVVDYLNDSGINSSIENRRKLYSERYGSGYRGTAQQNLQLLQSLRSTNNSTIEVSESRISPISLNNNEVSQPEKIQVYTGDEKYNVRNIAKRKGRKGDSDYSMKYTMVDGKYIAYPTLFQEESGEWIEKNDINQWEALNEARKRGETFEFDNEKDAAMFTAGNWRSNYKTYDTSSPEYKELYNSGRIATYDRQADSYMFPNLPEVTVTAKVKRGEWMDRVDKQNELIQENQYEKGNYAIIDKKHNRIFYYDSKGNKVKDEEVITGMNNKDTDYSISMRDYLKANPNASHEDYFDFLEKNESRVTPSGHFTISSLRDNVLDNPDKIGDFWNSLFNNERRQKILQNRKRDYGSQNKLFTLKDDNNVSSSKAIHGTDNPNRESVLNEDVGFKSRDLSNGCINVGDNSICFDHLTRGSGIYILPEESPELVTKKNTPVNNGNVIKKSKSKIYNTLKDLGLNADEEVLNKIATIHGKESTFGTNKRVSLEDSLPFFESDGEFQINPKSFSDYLPEDYKPEFKKDVQAVYNFVMKNKELNLSQLYALYNSGRATNKLSKEMENTLSAIYKRVANVK